VNAAIFLAPAITMPIEIKELHIRVSVSTPPSGQPAGERTPSGSISSQDGEEAKDALIAECVEKVMQILHNKMER
jgi:hypothetical protein